MSINPTHGVPPEKSQTAATSEISPDFLAKLTDLAVPEFHVLGSSVLGLVNGQIAVLVSMQDQLEMVKSLTLSVSDDQFVDLKASALHGFTDDLLRKIAIVELLVGELHSLIVVKDSALQEQLANCRGANQ